MNLSQIDFAISGDGEYPLWKLVCALYFNEESIEHIPNLLFRKEGRIIRNPVESNFVQIDDLPIPDRTLVKYKEYYCPIGTNRHMATLISSRGCPYRCTFCNSIDKSYRPRKIENVINEVKYLYSMGFREIFFFDDLFGFKKERLLEFCAGLKREKIKLHWGFKARVSIVDEELAGALKMAGCERIQFGLETHTDEGLKSLKKDITITQIKNAVSLCYKYKIHSMGSFMINLPGDTRESILERFSFANSLKLDYCQYAILVAYNHCEIFDDGVKRGYWSADLWSNFVSNPDFEIKVPLIDNGISRMELDDLLDYGLNSFYFRLGLIFQRLRNLQSLTEVLKLFRGAIRLLKIKKNARD